MTQILDPYFDCILKSKGDFEFYIELTIARILHMYINPSENQSGGQIRSRVRTVCQRSKCKRTNALKTPE